MGRTRLTLNAATSPGDPAGAAHRTERRIGAVLRLLLAALLGWSAGCAAAAPSAPHRIVAIGDLHGDAGAWTAVAQAAGVMDKEGHWSGGATVLVQTGDVVDRGPDSLRIQHDLMRLQAEAPRAGGRVVALVGNHEAMNVLGDLRYVHPGEFAAFARPDSARRRDLFYANNRPTIEAAYRKKDRGLDAAAIRKAWLADTPLGWIEHRLAWAPSGEIGQWVLSNPAAVTIGDTLFVHGGLTPGYARLGIDAINRRTAKALARRDTAEDSIINDERGPLWYRGYVMGDEQEGRPISAGSRLATARGAPRADVKSELDAALAAVGARRLVIGHTPVLGGIAVAQGGRVICIDTGMSRFYGGPLTYLDILDGNPVPHRVPRPAEAR